MMLIIYERYSYDSLSKSRISKVYHDICKSNIQAETISRSDEDLILEFNRKYSEVLVKVVVRHYDLFQVCAPSLKIYLRITSLFHYSNRASRMAYDRLITVKHMRAKIGSVPLNFRGVKRDEDDYED